jgi:hypothetical protein
MFWFAMYLMARPRYPRRITVNHVHWQHPRFHNPWYWLTGLAFMELALWLMVFEIAGEGLALWWLLWWVAKRIVFFAGDHRPVPGGAYRMLDATRPVWPRREATA